MTNNTSNPWIGLDSYREGQILYGRSREIRDLSMAVFYNRQTVVYGRSGIGKSSLLHAGIFPEARLRGCLPVSVRFDHSGATGYSDQFFRVISDAVKAVGGTMHDMVSDNEPPRSMWEFFHRFRPEKDGKELTPLIVVDQFEEIFTLSKNPAQVSAFFDELADLLNDVMPDYLQSSVQQVVKPTGGSMFDGLDFHMPDNRYLSDTNFHLVLVLREDYLSYLERFSGRIPALKQNRYGLLPITYTQAQEIITQPRPGLVSTEVADAIIRQVVTEEQINADTPVDSAILSLFLSRLYEKKGDAENISMQLVEDQGDALLEDFYAEIVASLDKKTVMFLEDTLINADGHRENITLESLYKINWLQRATIEKLEQSHLLRLFSYGDVQRVEFAHDVLCPIIVRRRSQRENEARYRKSKRRAIWAYLIIFLGFFLVLATVEIVDQKLEEIRVRNNRLTEMEASLIENSTRKILREHDCYGAIRLLINSIPEDQIAHPTSAIANNELVLRSAMELLPDLKEDSCIGKVNYEFSLEAKRTAVLSPSKRLVGFNDSEGVIVIADPRTGAIVWCYSTHAIVSHSVFLDETSYWRYHVENDRVVLISQDNKSRRLSLCDIHPLDSRCLIIADDTTVLDCYMSSSEYDAYDYKAKMTRLCLRGFQDTVINAAYSEEGDRIAVMLADSTCLLYDANTGKAIDDKNAATIMQAVTSRQYSLLRKYNGAKGIWNDLVINDSLYLRPTSFSRVMVCGIPRLENPYENVINPSIFKPTEEDIIAMRNQIDSTELPPYLMDFQRSYKWDENAVDWEHGERYYWPMGFNARKDRVILMKPRNEGDKHSLLYGVYPESGGVFYTTALPMDVHTIHFSEDDNWIVINSGEETQLILYVPRLDTLLETCKQMFFKWKMSEDERFQTYIHMND